MHAPAGGTKQQNRGCNNSEHVRRCHVLVKRNCQNDVISEKHGQGEGQHKKHVGSHVQHAPRLHSACRCFSPCVLFVCWSLLLTTVASMLIAHDLSSRFQIVSSIPLCITLCITFNCVKCSLRYSFCSKRTAVTNTDTTCQSSLLRTYTCTICALGQRGHCHGAAGQCLCIDRS